MFQTEKATELEVFLGTLSINIKHSRQPTFFVFFFFFFNKREWLSKSLSLILMEWYADVENDNVKYDNYEIS